RKSYDVKTGAAERHSKFCSCHTFSLSPASTCKTMTKPLHLGMWRSAPFFARGAQPASPEEHDQANAAHHPAEVRNDQLSGRGHERERERRDLVRRELEPMRIA